MEGHKRSRRAVTSRNITIETAVYTDAAYTKSMLVSDFSKRLQHILLKYHAVCTEDINLRIFFLATLELLIGLHLNFQQSLFEIVIFESDVKD